MPTLEPHARSAEPARGTPPTATTAWTRAAQETLPSARDLVVVRAGPDETPAFAAFARRRRAGVVRLEAPGHQELQEPFGVYAGARGGALDDLARAVVDLARPIRIERTFADAPFLDALERALGRGGRLFRRPRGGTPVLRLDAGWTDPRAHLSARRRSDLRRAERRAGDVEATIYAPGPDEVGARLREALDVESRSWRAARGGAIAEDAMRGPFLRRLAELAAAEGTLRLGLLRVDGKPAAMCYALVVGGSFWLLKIGYDEAFARCSPGVLLTVASIRHAAEAGLATYDFLGVREDWTALWTSEDRACVAVFAYPRGLASRAGLAIDLAAAAARKARLRLRRRPAGIAT